MTVNLRVLVIGGGYAGVLAANRLTQRHDVIVTLINPRPYFVERLRLHQLAAGSHGATVAYREVLSERVQLMVNTATRIHAGKRRVTLGSGEKIGYDYLIYAVGSGSTDSSVPGAAQHAYPIATFEQALQASEVLHAAGPGASVTVVGAGPAGIETAAELAELGRDVTLMCGGVLGPYLHPHARLALAKQLRHLGVNVLEGTNTKVTTVMPDAVQFADGGRLPSMVTIWTTGFGVPDLARRSGLSTDLLGRLLTDETLTSVDDVGIVAAGDCASPSGLPLRMSCQSAEPLGAHAADTVLSRIAGTHPAPLNIRVSSQCISLGRHDGLFQYATSEDMATRFYFSGPEVAPIKEAACRFVIKRLSKEARRPGSYRWPFKNNKRQLLLQTSGRRGADFSEQALHAQEGAQT